MDGGSGLSLECFLKLAGNLVGRRVHRAIHHFVGIRQRVVKRLFKGRLADRDQPGLIAGERLGGLLELFA
jgi:hypothetical protein